MNKLLGAGVLLVAASSAAQAGVVVVGKNSPIGPMDAETARNIFLGRNPIVAGQAVLVIYQQDGTENRAEFEHKVLGKSGAELSVYLSRQVFSGKAVQPTVVDGDAGVRAKLAGSTNAIGYVSNEGVDSSMKVILRY